MQPDDIEILIEKYFKGTITPDELIVLNKYYLENGSDQIDWVFENAHEEHQLQVRLFKQILKHRGIQHPKKTKFATNYNLAAAAIVLIFLAAGIFLYFHKSNFAPNSIVKNNSRYHNDVLPGRAKAVLILANGQKIDLDQANNGVIVRQGKTVINKEANGKLVYNQSTGPSVTEQMNTLIVPVSGQYQIVLSDGTKVWLNSKSSLKYPSKFIGLTRNVSLEGEAYFEVAKDAKHPFHVDVNNTGIQVLGTHFNIEAYDNSAVNTTLLEGSVKVTKGRQAHTILPGQQACTKNVTDNIVIQKVDVEDVIAWKNGFYQFKSKDIKSIMHDLERWYNIEVSYQRYTDDMPFSGKISRFKNISEVLGLLELTGDVHFKIEGRRVTVMP